MRYYIIENDEPVEAQVGDKVTHVLVSLVGMRRRDERLVDVAYAEGEANTHPIDYGGIIKEAGG